MPLRKSVMCHENASGRWNIDNRFDPYQPLLSIYHKTK